MIKPRHIIEVFLQPGEFYFGDHNTRIRTLLGSCIAITLWHPKLLIGGMCHFVLPTRNPGFKESLAGHNLDGHYGDEAMVLFMNEIRLSGTKPADYEVKLFGGSNMFLDTMSRPCTGKKCSDPFSASCKDISCRNRRSAQLLAQRHGFMVKAKDLGGTQPHNIFFDIWSGRVWVKNQPRILEPVEKNI